MVETTVIYRGQMPPQSADWEAPIDAASHVGNRDITLFLLDYGARLTTFTFAMLGHVDVVKSLLTAQPAFETPWVHMDSICFTTLTSGVILPQQCASF
jgi:hypothetical protein